MLSAPTSISEVEGVPPDSAAAMGTCIAAGVVVHRELLEWVVRCWMVVHRELLERVVHCWMVMPQLGVFATPNQYVHRARGVK